MSKSVLILVLAMGLGCGDPPPSVYPVQELHAEDTNLGASDVFEVRVFRQADMTGSYRIDANGAITFPLIGVVDVAGKTPGEVADEIRTRLADGYLLEPQVSVFVKEYNSKKVSVLGQVRKPGTFGFADRMTVVEAIAEAGGFTGMARTNAVTVTRVVGDSKKQYTVPVGSIGKGGARNFLVRPGDVVFVPERIW